MNIKKFLPLIAAAGLGLVALIVAHSGLGRGSKQTADKTIHVIVAKESVAPGQALTPDNLSEQAIAGTTLPRGAHTGMNDLVGRISVAPMVPGQPVLDAFLAAPALGGLPALIPLGMRAVTVDVNESTGVAGMIAPGSRVDVISVLNQGEHDKVISKTVCSNVPVVAVGQRLSANREANDTSMARTVTLIAKPREAELIRLAFLTGNTSLMLRGNGDMGPADSRGVQFADLEGKPVNTPMPKAVIVSNTGVPTTQSAVIASAAPVSHTRRVQLIQGDKVTTISFEIPDTTNTDTADPDDYTNIETAPVFPNQK